MAAPGKPKFFTISGMLIAAVTAPHTRPTKTAASVYLPVAVEPPRFPRHAARIQLLWQHQLTAG